MSQPWTWIEINQSRFTQNLKTIRNCLEGRNFGIVLKANAYGHGLDIVFPLAHPFVDVVFIFSLEDVKTCRQIEKKNNLAKKRLVLLGPYEEKDLGFIVKNDIEICFEPSVFASFRKKKKSFARPIKLHAFFDTGLSREGILEEDVESFINFLKDHKNQVDFIGILSHLSDAEIVALTEKQRERFLSFYERLKPWASRLEMSLSASLGFLKEVPLDFPYVTCRIGLLSYGLWPSEDARKDFLKEKALSEDAIGPILSWKARASSIKYLKPGDQIGYSGTFCCTVPTTVALFPVGYSDGFPWSLSNRGFVLYQGQRLPILGRVMMNYIVVDITALNWEKLPLVVTLLGAENGEKSDEKRIPFLEDLTLLAHSFNYEMVTRLSSKIERIVVHVN